MTSEAWENSRFLSPIQAQAGRDTGHRVETGVELMREKNILKPWYIKEAILDLDFFLSQHDRKLC